MSLARKSGENQQCVFVSQHLMAVESFVRSGDKQWLFTPLEKPESLLRLQQIDCAIPLEAIYYNIQFDTV